MLRTYFGEMAICLFILASFFFSLIFLIGLANNTKTDNAIMNQVPLQQAEVSRWGQIPGDLGFAFDRQVSIYSRDEYSYTPGS